MAEENIIKPMSIPELVGHNFFIPDYQRGYRWEVDQIQQLLEDLYRYFNSSIAGDFYCLQPIVVKKCDDNMVARYKLQSSLDNNTWYEVIDGQQRLTTIRILLSFYQLIVNHVDSPKDEDTYCIRYATRPELGGIFEKINMGYGSVWTFNSSKIEETDVEPKDRKFDNVDAEYVKIVGKCIIDWFVKDAEQKGLPVRQKTASNFFSDFYNEYQPKSEISDKSINYQKSVAVLWYEIKGNVDGRVKFEEINDLTVSLSSSELVRALFLSESTDFTDEHESEYPAINNAVDREIAYNALRKSNKEKKQLTIKTQWDEIEHRLHNDKFWNFLTSKSSSSYRNRIELLLDIMSKKFVKNMAGDPLYTYVYFYHKVKNSDPWSVWGEVYDCFCRLTSWLEDRNYYHKIGYLCSISKNDEHITGMLDYVLNHTKKEFDAFLIATIKKTIDLWFAKEKRNKKISELNYQDKHDYRQLKKIMLLYNVEYTNQTKVEPDFPFGSYNKLKGMWSLEHIHAQNSEYLDPQKKDDWREWMIYNKKALENRFDVLVDENRKKLRDELVENLKSNIKILEENRASYSYEDFTDIFRRVFSFDELGNDEEKDKFLGMHQISNMALLDIGSNAAIGKSPFDTKRQIIDKQIAEGKFVPLCTKKVFQKSFCKVDDDIMQNVQRYTWDSNDRELYFSSIKSVLNSYFSESEWG